MLTGFAPFTEMPWTMPPELPSMITFAAHLPMIETLCVICTLSAYVPESTAMTAPGVAAATAAPMVVKCVASVAPLALTKSVAFVGGNAAEQSPTGTHVVLPSAARVAPVHGSVGSTSRHP